MQLFLRAFCVAVLLVTEAWAQGTPARKSQDLTIAIVPAKDKSGAAVIDREGEFPVVFTNRSDKPIRLWAESCQPGHETLSFRVEEAGQSSEMYKAAASASSWKDKPPRPLTIPTGGRLSWNVMPSSFFWGERQWTGVPEPNTGKPVKLTAVFEIKPSDAAKAHGVWTGRVTSEPVEVLFVDAKIRTPHEYLWAGCPKQALKIMKADRMWINKTDEQQQTPLHIAVRFGFSDVVRWLLSNGAEINARAYNRFAPLHMAREPEMVKLLLGNKADINAENVSGRTALEEAASEYAHFGEYPEYAAAREHWRAIVKTLLDAGARYDIRTACYLGDVERLKVLLKDKKQARDKDAMRMAAMYGHATIVKLLLDNGADPTDADYWGLPISYFAIEHPAVLKVLFDAGADPGVFVTYRGNGQGPEGSTLLHEAAVKGAVESAKLLLARGIDVNTRGGVSATPLHLGCLHGHVPMVEFLLKNKADANARTKEGWSAMSLSAHQVRPEHEEDNARHQTVIRTLARYGVEVDVFAAIACDDLERVTAILRSEPKAGESKKSPGRPALHRAVILDRKAIVKLLLDKGSNPDVRSEDESGYVGETALFEAAFWGRLQAAEALIKHGANVNAKAERGITPLHEAARMGQLDVARLLLKHGADANAEDNEGKTPLDWAGSYREVPEMTELLRSHARSRKTSK